MAGQHEADEQEPAVKKKRFKQSTYLSDDEYLSD